MTSVRGLAGLLSMTALGGCFLRPAPASPWDGLQIGTVVDVRLIDVYREGGPYLWWPGITGGPSCGAIDGLRAAVEIRLLLVDSRAPFGVLEFIARPLAGVSGVDFTGELRSPVGATIGTAVSSGTGWWRLQLYRHSSLDSSPLGELAMTGALPPIRVVRFLSDATGECSDEWVGELHEVPAAPDGGPDA